MMPEDRKRANVSLILEKVRRVQVITDQFTFMIEKVME